MNLNDFANNSGSKTFSALMRVREASIKNGRFGPYLDISASWRRLGGSVEDKRLFVNLNTQGGLVFLLSFLSAIDQILTNDGNSLIGSKESALDVELDELLSFSNDNVFHVIYSVRNGKVRLLAAFPPSALALRNYNAFEYVASSEVRTTEAESQQDEDFSSWGI